METTRSTVRERLNITLPRDFVSTTFEMFLKNHGGRTPELLGRLLHAAVPNSVTVSEPEPLENGRAKIDIHSVAVKKIYEFEAQGRVLFAEHSASKQPALFIAAEHEFETPADAEAATRMVQCFEHFGSFKTSTGEVVTKRVWTERDWERAIALTTSRVSADIRTSRRIVEERIQRFRTKGWLTVSEEHGETFVNLSVRSDEGADATDAKIAESILRLFHVAEAEEVIVPVPRFSTAQAHLAAIDSQFRTLSDLGLAISEAQERGTELVPGVSAARMWDVDTAILRRAETYCWFQDPIRAVDAASRSLPDDTTMTADLFPAPAGWWYLTEPLRCALPNSKTNQAYEDIRALLLGWVHIQGANQLLVAAFVDPATGSSATGLIPSTQFTWPQGAPLVTALTLGREEYQRSYGPDGGPWGAETTFSACEQLMRFVASGLLWVQQKILVERPEHVERHFRKRLETAHKLEQGKLREVSVVHLRRREVVKTTDTMVTTDGERKKVEWTCRWVVKGHWRDQFYPSTGVHKPKWIRSFDKGPEHLSLRTPAHRVMEVSR